MAPPYPFIALFLIKSPVIEFIVPDGYNTMAPPPDFAELSIKSPIIESIIPVL